MGELLDFKDRGNFEFFKFSSYYGDNKQFQSSLKSKCEHVLEYAHATVQDMCLLGYNLKELKESGKWQWVVNPEKGYCFDGGSFGDFCAYAFGFSKTRTSDLLRISKFVKISGTKTGFLQESFQKFNTSQLVELSSVEEGRLHYFKPEMTVEDMRLIKRYMEWGHYWDELRKAKADGVEFDIMAHAKAWKEKEDNKKSGKVQPLNEVLDGQITLEELEEVEETPEKNPMSDLANSCEADESDEIESAREAARQAGIPFSDKPFEGPDDDFNPHVYDGSMSVADYKRMQEEIAEDDEDYAEPPEGGYYQGGGLDLDDEDDDEPEEETPEENPTSDLAIPCGYDPFDLVKGAAPFLKANLSNRNGIREFYRGFHDWEQIYSTIPFMRVYRYRFKTGTLFAVDFTSGNLLEDKAERKYENNVRYFWDGKEEPIPFEIRIFDLEKYIPLHKDEL